MRDLNYFGVERTANSDGTWTVALTTASASPPHNVVAGSPPPANTRIKLWQLYTNVTRARGMIIIGVRKKGRNYPIFVDWQQIKTHFVSLPYPIVVEIGDPSSDYIYATAYKLKSGDVLKLSGMYEVIE